MPEYEYKAIGRNGAESVGHEHAADVEALKHILRKQQLTLLHAKPKKTSLIGRALVIAFTSELAPLVESGLPLDRALQIIGEDSRDAKITNLAAQLRKSIKRGESFSQALQNYGRFDPMLIALIQVSEASGDLAQVLKILERHYQDSQKIRHQLISSLTYPVILALVALLSIIGLALYVVPVFKDIFSEGGDHLLPLGTRILFSASDFLINYGWMVIILAGAGAASGAALVNRNDAVNRKWHTLMLRIPLLGKLQAHFAAFKLAKSLSIMLAAGLPLVRGIEISRPLLDNRIQREGLDICLNGLRKGESVPQAFAHVPALPVQFTRYLKLGNETGGLAPSMSKVADLLQEEFGNRLNSLVGILNPLIIIVMGGIVGFMVMSILLAVFSLSEVR
jgi:general secretion pathway protein F